MERPESLVVDQQSKHFSHERNKVGNLLLFRCLSRMEEQEDVECADRWVEDILLQIVVLQPKQLGQVFKDRGISPKYSAEWFVSLKIDADIVGQAACRESNTGDDYPTTRHKVSW